MADIMYRRAIPVQYTPESLLSYIARCIIVDNGVPRFRDSTFGMPLPDNHVLATCVDFDGVDVLPSMMFVGVPDKIKEVVAQRYQRGDIPEWLKLFSMLSPIDNEMLSVISENLRKRPLTPEEIGRINYFSMLGEGMKLPKEKVMSIINDAIKEKAGMKQ